MEPSRNPVKLDLDALEAANADAGAANAAGVAADAADAPPTPAETPAAAEPAPVAPPAERTAAVQPVRVPGERSLEERVVEAIKTIYDPEIPVNIYELGLIYDIAADPETGTVDVKMTLTSPACPVAGSLPGEVEQKVAGVSGVDSATVELVWDPAWNQNMMSEAAKLELGFF